MTQAKKPSLAEKMAKSTLDELSVIENLDTGAASSAIPGEAENDPFLQLQKMAPERTTLLNPSDKKNEVVSDQSAPERTVVVKQSGRPISEGGGVLKESSPRDTFGKARPSSAQNVDPQLLRAEGLRISQKRITELERDLEKYREENEMLSSALEVAKRTAEEAQLRYSQSERERAELAQQSEGEIKIYRENLAERERQIQTLKKTVEELEYRLKSDLKRIRVRERELENRLELLRSEKGALLQTKDSMILELKRQVDFLNSEIDSYKRKFLGVHAKVEGQHEQIARTVRALRLALTNLEVNEPTNSQINPLKKAE